MFQLRWIEWTIMAILLNPSVRRTPHALHWFIGTENRDRLWRIGGIVILAWQIFRSLLPWAAWFRRGGFCADENR